MAAKASEATPEGVCLQQNGSESHQAQTPRKRLAWLGQHFPRLALSTSSGSRRRKRGKCLAGWGRRSEGAGSGREQHGGAGR